MHSRIDANPVSNFISIWASLLIVAGIFAPTARAQCPAIPLAPSDTIFSLTDCTSIFPGTLLATSSAVFTSPSGHFSGTLVSAVYRDPSGTLDFYYQVQNNPTCPQSFCDSLTRVIPANFANYQTAVATSSGAGLPMFVNGDVVPPSADRSPLGDTIGFDFSPPITGRIPPGQTSAVLMIFTDAKNYATGTVSIIDGAIATVSSFGPVPGVATPSGSNISVQPKDATTGATGAVNVTFPSVTTPGVTTLVTSTSGPTLPPGFQLGSPATYYDISTTAVFTPPAVVCINYGAVSYSDATQLKLYHYESGVWVDHTVSNDTTNKIICGSVSSFSPFAIVAPTNTTPPVIAATLTPKPNAAGWNNSDVTVVWSVTPASASQTGCNTTAVQNETAGTTLTCSATNSSGQSGSSAITIKLDKTPPSITLSARTSANPAGWNNTAISLQWACSDALSGVSQANISKQVATEAGNQSSAATCMDVAGNSASDTQTGINIDLTPPALTFGVATPAANASGWNNTNVSVPFTATDNLSGVSGATPPANPIVLMSEGGAVNATVTVTDVAGNARTFTTPMFKIDKTPPGVIITTPASGAVYLLRQAVTANYACADGLSGVGACNGPIVSGAQLDTATVGTKSFAVTGTDVAGNTTTATNTYTVIAPYVTNAASNTVTAINPATHSALATITVGIAPVHVVFAPNGANAYVTNSFSNSVSVIQTATNTVVATVRVGHTPLYAAVTSDGKMLYVTNSGAASVSIIDTGTNTVIATVSVGSHPVSAAVTQDGARVYVVNAGSNTVSAINTADNTVLTIPVGAIPIGLALGGNGYAYVANTGAGSMSVIGTANNNVVATVPVGIGPVAVAIAPGGAAAYVANAASNSVSVINTTTNMIAATVHVGAKPIALAVTPNGKKVYAANSEGSSISVIDTTTNTVLTTVNVGFIPTHVEVTSDGSSAYVTNAGSASVSIINTATDTVSSTVAVGAGPVNVALH